MKSIKRLNIVMVLLLAIFTSISSATLTLTDDSVTSSEYLDIDATQVNITSELLVTENATITNDLTCRNIITDDITATGDVDIAGNLDIDGITVMGSDGFRLSPTDTGGSIRLNITQGGDIYTEGTWTNDGNIRQSGDYWLYNTIGLLYPRVHMSSAGIDVYDGTVAENIVINLTNAGDITASGTATVGLLISGDTINYLNINDTGYLTLHGDARTTNDLWIDAGGIKAPGLKPALLIAHGTIETPAWQFADEAVAGNQETISWNMRIPNRMDKTVAPSIAIGWSADGISPGICEWQLEYLWTSIGEDTTASAQGNITVNGTASSTSNGMILSTFTIDIPSGTDVCIHCRLKRLSAGTNDTIANDVEVHGVCLSFTSNKLGA